MASPSAPARPPTGAAPRLARSLVLVALLGLALLPPHRGLAEDQGPGSDAPVEAWLRAARDARPAVVRVQWRSHRRPSEVVERHAVVIDRDGWLVMAGPRPTGDGTLAATFVDGRSMRARIWASDPASGVTLLRVPVTALRSLRLRPPEPDGKETLGVTPPRWRPGFRFVLVTAEGAVAHGELRASHRRRVQGATPRGQGVEVTCLDEAALTVLPTDLGAPWIDEKGRLVGLLVGAKLGTEIENREAGGAGRLRVRPRVVAAYGVPSQVLRVVWPLLRDHREVARAALGLSSVPLSEAIARHVCPDCGGRVVRAILPGGAAHQAGLLPKDIIREVDGLALARDATLGDALLPYRPGDRIRLGILRRGQPEEVEVVLRSAR